MQTLTIGEVTFVADAAGLSLAVQDSGHEPVRVSPREAGLLQDFLRRHAPEERRVGFRVQLGPVGEEVQRAFQVYLGSGADARPVRPVDLSLTGILVQAPRFPTRRGKRLALWLEYGGLTCRLTGVVVRLKDDLVALHFADSVKNGDLTPPEGLMAIYRKIEIAWLRSRLE